MLLSGVSVVGRVGKVRRAALQGLARLPASIIRSASTSVCLCFSLLVSDIAEVGDIM